MAAEVSRGDRLTDGDVEEVRALVAAATAADGVRPFDEHALLRLGQGGDPAAVHLRVRDPAGRLSGYARLEPGDGVTGELAVDPAVRRRGYGRRLATAALAEAGGGVLRVWAHGDLPAAAGLATALGFTRSRVLLQLRRSLRDQLPAPALPDGVGLRTFRPGADEEAWLATNARAFAEHPEQGRWTAADLRLRMAEPWFDPAGFFLAERDGRLLGFHWTKVHPDGTGEVYVLGVDPGAHGGGLGRALALAGLGHLRDRGLDRAMLYVEESNPAAVALYTKLGFTRWSADVVYTRGR